MVAAPQRNIPTVFVAFGATGDLMRRKVIPAVFHLFARKELPERFRIVGFSRRDWGSDEFRAFIKEVIEAHRGSDVQKEMIAPFLKLFHFQKGTFDEDENYEKLGRALATLDAEWGVCGNKLFYLSVAPEFYKSILTRLSKHGLIRTCAPGEGWTHIIVEKPLGLDSKTAREIDERLGKLFTEDQIYRIDHYLAKEMLQNILTFRFSNNLFELVWKRELIESIRIRLLEGIGVEDRGEFYDRVGALRDVGQNHLLQMLALVTMEAPENFDARSIQKRRAEILGSLEILSPADVARATFRAQYKGYRSIRGVAPESNTETYFKIRGELTHPNWRGVPIIFESGKRMGEARKEILITFRRPMPCLCPKGLPDHKNEVIFRMEPREEILIEFWSKSLGFSFATERRMFHYMLRERSAHVPYVEEYAKLLLDCIHGDQTLFISTEEIRAMWRWTDPIIAAWRKDKAPLHSYKPDSDDVRKASAPIDTAAPVSFAKYAEPIVRKEIGIIGLGKMGGNVARRLLERGWRVRGYTSRAANAAALEREGMTLASSVADVVEGLPAPRLVWLMTTAGEAVDEVLFGKEKGEKGIVDLLAKGDIVVDAGNSFYKDTVARARKLKKRGIRFVDIGFSGGPGGARTGACLMVGGEQRLYKQLEPLFADLSVADGYQFFRGAGAGHFVKMVHNGIEYGMMQALGEGFALMKKSAYKLDLSRIADVYNHGSVIESRLVGWLRSAFALRGEDLRGVSGSVSHTGEGLWTVKTARQMKLEAKVIEEALKFRVRSQKKPNYTGKIVSALREQFGGHDVGK